MALYDTEQIGENIRGLCFFFLRAACAAPPLPLCFPENGNNIENDRNLSTTQEDDKAVILKISFNEKYAERMKGEKTNNEETIDCTRFALKFTKPRKANSFTNNEYTLAKKQAPPAPRLLFFLTELS